MKKKLIILLPVIILLAILALYRMPQSPGKSPGKDSASPLITAARHGDLAALRHWLEKGLDLQVKDEQGLCALHYAAHAGYEQVARLLIAHGAVVNSTGAFGWTPLHLAAARGRINVAQLLISQGADIQAKTVRGATPLHYAAIYGQRDMVEYLLAKGADVNAQASGWTALHDALLNKRDAVAALLIQKGADITISDPEGRTPRTLAGLAGVNNLKDLLIPEAEEGR